MKKDREPKYIKPPGRPSEYDPKMNEMIFNYCLLGATDEEMSRFLEIDYATFQRWKAENQILRDTIKAGKEDADARVSNSLYCKAIGYWKEEEETKVVSLGAGRGSEVQTVKINRYYPPDTRAAEFWLKNRRMKDWRERQTVEISDVTDKAKALEEARERIKCKKEISSENL